MNLHDSKAKLWYGAQKLQLHWGEAQTQWNDAVSRDFERDFLTPLEPRIVATVAAIERLNEILSKAQQECQ